MEANDDGLKMSAMMVKGGDEGGDEDEMKVGEDEDEDGGR